MFGLRHVYRLHWRIDSPKPHVSWTCLVCCLLEGCARAAKVEPLRATCVTVIGLVFSLQRKALHFPPLSDKSEVSSGEEKN